MKIILLTRGIPSKENPQEGCFEWDQACALKTIGHEPIIISLDAKFRSGHHKWGIINEYVNGIETYTIYGGTTTIIEHFISFKLSQWYNKYLTTKLFKYVIKKHPDAQILHAHYLKLIYRAVGIANKFNIPLVGTEHLSDIVKDPLSKKLELLGNKSYYKLDQLITVSPFLKDSIYKRFKVDSKVCGNVLGKEFIETPFYPNKPTDCFTYVACGSLIERKGYKTLIEAFSRLENINCQLFIIGSGPQKNELGKLIKYNGLHDKIKLLGRKDKHEIIKILDIANCFVLSSKSETFGVVAIEALSRGLPVITTKCGGINGIINSNNGVYVEVGDPKMMSVAMRNVKDNITKYDPLTIRKQCLDNYSPLVIAKKLESIYLAIINKRKQ